MDVTRIAPLVQKIQPRFGGRGGRRFEQELAQEDGGEPSARRPSKGRAGDPGRRERPGSSGTDGLKVDLLA